MKMMDSDLLELFRSTSTMRGDLINVIVLLSVVTIVGLLYLVRLSFRGRARFDRVDREVGSALMGKGPMEMGYWALQPVARFLVFFHVTPNMLSWTSLVLAILTAACLSVGHFGFGAVFATVSALMDTLDGMVARLTHVQSDAGEVLDASIDRYVEFLFLAGLTFYYREIPVMLGLTLLAMMGSFMVSYSTAKAEALNVKPPRGNMRRTERGVYLILGAVLSPISIPWFESSGYFPVPLGYPMVFAVTMVAVLANFSAVERLYAIAREIRLREATQKKKPASVQADALEHEEETNVKVKHP